MCDDDFFEKVMEDKGACQELLRVLMSDPKLIVVEAGVQKNVKNPREIRPAGHAVQTWGWCHGDVEVQRARK